MTASMPTEILLPRLKVMPKIDKKEKEKKAAELLQKEKEAAEAAE